MFRFTMPDNTLGYSDRLSQLREQTGALTGEVALSEIFSLLRVDRDELSEVYNGRRRPGGRVLETQALSSKNELEGIRYELYPLFRELGFIDINKPQSTEHTHILVLGGALNATYLRTQAAAKLAAPGTRFIDGLSCFRPINPIERSASAFPFAGDTEFGAMSEAFASVFMLPGWKDEFSGDRNLNLISCIRSSRGAADGREYRIFAAPSAQPELRRADTGDSFLFFMEHTELSPDDRLLAVTNNLFCNRQFLQLAYCLLKKQSRAQLDIVGCLPDESVTTPDSYDPFRYIQELIALLSWIDRFDKDFERTRI